MKARASNTSNFKTDVLNNTKPVLVDFWAAWCAPCRAISPVLDAIAEEHSEKIAVVKVNIDENPHLAQQFGIRSIPALRVFRNGKITESFNGALSKSALETKLVKYLR
ncbi:thioredoxin [Pseudomonas atacamensis]|uniref:Thioredoxin n=1 Tax=Pseudomonas atacamensis TaxID=2565368 RepID=A0AAQ2DE91_9PSED|nr:thioredoxin [Pseudomonas atacamensis]THF34519.1 thioredoxin [Pseudomonas atacamensis]